jgi:hypothetical protein
MIVKQERGREEKIERKSEREKIREGCTLCTVLKKEVTIKVEKFK